MKKELSQSILLAAQNPYRLSLKASVAGLLCNEGDIESSYRTLLECLLVNPFFIPAQLALAINRLLAKKYDMAFMEFEQTLRLDPGNMTALWGKAITLCLVGRQQQALDLLMDMASHNEMEEVAQGLLKKYFLLDQSSSLSHRSVFDAYHSTLSENRSRTAYDLLKDLGSNVESARLKLILVDFLIGRGERKTARRIMEKLLDNYPAYPDLLYKLAKMYNAEGAQDKARELLQTIADANPIYSDTDKIMNGTPSSYSKPEDRTFLEELNAWCKEVIKNTGIKEAGLKDAPANINLSQTTEIVIPIQPVEEIIDTKDTKELSKEDISELIIQENTPVVIDEPEPSLEFQQVHLERTRRILEEAKKMLEQTKITPPPKELPLFEAETPRRETVKAETPEPKIINLFDQENSIASLEAPQPKLSEPELILHTTLTVDSIPTEIKESPMMYEFETSPKRIVLQTSDEEPEMSEKRAWSLLKDGQAEEAFLMFSKLIRKEQGRATTE
jgi:tetratricopeptide (TPR) repeat protein